MSFFSLLAPGKPDNVSLVPVSATQLNLTWESPSDPNGIITGYRVIWKMVRDDNNMLIKGSDSKTQVINNKDAEFFPIMNLGKHIVMQFI